MNKLKFLKDKVMRIILKENEACEEKTVELESILVELEQKKSVFLTDATIPKINCEN